MRILFAIVSAVVILLPSCHDGNESITYKFSLQLRKDDNIKEIDLLFISGNDTIAGHHSEDASARVNLDLPGLAGKVWKATILAFGEHVACGQTVYKKVYRYEGEISYESNTEVVVSYLDEGWKEGFYSSYGADESLVEIFQFPSAGQYDLEIHSSSDNIMEYGYIDLYTYYHLPDNPFNPCMYDVSENWNWSFPTHLTVSMTIENQCGTDEEISTFDSYIQLEMKYTGEVSHYLMWDNSLNTICN